MVFDEMRLASILTVVFFMLGIYLLLCAFFPDLVLLGVITSPSLLISASGSVFAAGAVVYTAYCFKANIRRDESAKLLKTIQGYLFEASEIIASFEFGGHYYNKNRFEHAVYLIESSIKYSKELPVDAHKKIFVSELNNCAFKIFNTVSTIKDHTFFTGQKVSRTSEAFKSEGAVSYESALFLYKFLLLYKHIGQNKLAPSKLIKRFLKVSFLKKVSIEKAPEELKSLALYVKVLEGFSQGK